MKKNKIRPIGHVLLDMEPLLLEMVEEQDLQLGDVLNLIRGYLEVHAPNCIETYLDDTQPVFYYGPKK